MMVIARWAARIGMPALVGATILGIPSAHAQPQVCPPGATVEADGCSVRLTAVTADSTDGTLSGMPVGGSIPITVFGEPRNYLRSTGFTANPPDLVRQWDETIDRVGANPSDPNADGEGKAYAFLSRQLNELATRLPPGTIVLRSVPDTADPHLFVLQSIQPVAP